MKPIQVFRANFKTSYGSSSMLIAVDCESKIHDAIIAWEKKTNSVFLSLEDKCVMTPSLFEG